MDKTSTIILAISLIIIMLGMGLSLRISDFKNVLVYPKAICIGLLNQLVLLPLIGLAIVSLLPMPPEIAVGIMILAACPGGATSNLISYMARADLALSVSLTAVSSICSVFTIPFIVNYALENYIGERNALQLNVLETIAQIAVIILIPIIIGMIVRHYRPAFADKMNRPVRIASGAILAIVVVALLIKERDTVMHSLQQAGLATLALNASTMAIGFASAKLLRLKRDQAVSIAIESGIQNSTLAISIAVVLLGNSSLAIAASVYSLAMYFTAGFVIYYSVKAFKKEQEGQNTG